jgi:hypothetical protein
MVIGHQFRRDRKSGLWTPNRKPALQSYINWQHPIVRERSLIGCWLGNEGGGNTLYDLSLTRQDGIFTGTTAGWSQTFPSNPVIQVTGDGTTDRIDLGSIAGTDPLSGFSSQELSIAFDFYWADAATNTFPRLIDKSDAGSAINGWAIWMVDATKKLAFSVNNNDLQVFTNAISAGLHHGLVTAKTGDSVFYIDGVDDTSAGGGDAFTFVNATTNAAILNWNHAVDREWSGWIAYIYIWNRILSASEVAQLHRKPYAFIESPRPNRGALFEAVAPVVGNVAPLINAGLVNRGLINGGLVN